MLNFGICATHKSSIIIIITTTTIIMLTFLRIIQSNFLLWTITSRALLETDVTRGINHTDKNIQIITTKQKERELDYRQTARKTARDREQNRRKSRHRQGDTDGCQ